MSYCHVDIGKMKVKVMKNTQPIEKHSEICLIKVNDAKDTIPAKKRKTS